MYCIRLYVNELKENNKQRYICMIINLGCFFLHPPYISLYILTDHIIGLEFNQKTPQETKMYRILFLLLTQEYRFVCVYHHLISS